MSSPVRFTPTVIGLPAAVPFVGPETLERQRGEVFQARVGANESAFGVSPKARQAMVDCIDQIAWYNDPEGFDLRQAQLDALRAKGGTIASSAAAEPPRCTPAVSSPSSATEPMLGCTAKPSCAGRSGSAPGERAWGSSLYVK